MTLGITGRLLLIVLAAILPPLTLLSLAQAWAEGLSGTGQQSIRLAVVVLAVLWAAVVAILGRAWIRLTEESIVAAAERRTGGEPAPSAAVERFAVALERRDRQLSQLVELLAAAPIERGAAAVFRRVILATQSATEDPTWFGVVGRGDDRLPAGVYASDDGEPEELNELHRWAAVTAPETPRAVVASGPWGAFLLLRVTSSDDLSVLLVAPWEGRPQLTEAEQVLLTLTALLGSGELLQAALFERLRRQAEDLDRLAALQRDFLRGVTHDLQSPLASISTTAAELREAPAAALPQGLESIEHQAQRLGRMVTQLLTMSGLEAGVVTPRDDLFRAETVVQRVIESTRLPAERVRYRRIGPDRLAVGDPDRLEQAVWSVLENALKYSPAGAAVGITLSPGADGDRLTETIEIADEGLGMDADTQARAFERFYRAPGAREIAPNGSGIGLYNAKALMELMGGSIEISSTLGRGTRVTLSLPAEPAVE